MAGGLNDSVWETARECTRLKEEVYRLRKECERLRAELAARQEAPTRRADDASVCVCCGGTVPEGSQVCKACTYDPKGGGKE